MVEYQQKETKKKTGGWQGAAHLSARDRPLLKTYSSVSVGVCQETRVSVMRPSKDNVNKMLPVRICLKC